MVQTLKDAPTKGTKQTELEQKAISAMSEYVYEGRVRRPRRLPGATSCSTHVLPDNENTSLLSCFGIML